MRAVTFYYVGELVIAVLFTIIFISNSSNDILFSYVLEYLRLKLNLNFR